MTRTAAALVLALTLTACGHNAEPDVKVTATPTPTVSVTATATPTPDPSETESDPIETGSETPAELADVFREESAAAQPWRFKVTAIAAKPDDVSEVMTTLTASDPADDAVGVCVFVHNFLVDRDGSPLAKVRLRVRDKNLRVVADDLSGRCTAT